MTVSDSWRKAILPVDATMEQAINSLNSSGLQIVLIVTEDDTVFFDIIG